MQIKSSRSGSSQHPRSAVVPAAKLRSVFRNITATCQRFVLVDLVGPYDCTEWYQNKAHRIWRVFLGLTGTSPLVELRLDFGGLSCLDWCWLGNDTGSCALQMISICVHVWLRPRRLICCSICSILRSCFFLSVPWSSSDMVSPFSSLPFFGDPFSAPIETKSWWVINSNGEAFSQELVDCVQCQRCRLHAKLFSLGLGTVSGTDGILCRPWTLWPLDHYSTRRWFFGIVKSEDYRLRVVLFQHVSTELDAFRRIRTK